jgi:hypothetical protein
VVVIRSGEISQFTGQKDDVMFGEDDIDRFLADMVVVDMAKTTIH